MVLQNLDRAHLALSSDIDQLNSTLSDWAAWNDTYAFIMDRNQNYISANLNTSSLSNLRLNLILFVDSSGQLVFAKMMNLDTKRETPVPQNFLKDLFKKGTLLCRNESDMFKGIVLLPEGALLISSQPILTSEGKGPVRGTLIMGRYLDSELTHLSDLTQLPLVSQRINDSNMSSDFAAAQSSILKGNPILVNPLSENSIAGYALIKDIYGDPALILRVDLPRDIYRQGESAIYYFAIYILLIGLIFAIVILFLLDKTFLSRIARLSLDVRNIGLSGDVSTRIPAAGKDELSSLSSNINDMLAKIDQSITDRKQIEEALKAEKDRAEKYLNIAEVILVALDTHARITLLNRRGYEILGYEEGELIGKDWIKTCLHPEDYERVLDFNNKIVAGKIEPLEYYESYILTKKGEERNIAWHTAVLKNDEGRIIGTLSSGEDITDRKRSENQLDAERSRLNAIIDNAPVGIVVADKDAKILLANQAAKKTCARDIPIGKAIERPERFCHLDGTPYKNRDFPLTKSALSGEVCVNEELIYTLPDGEKCHQLGNSAPIRDGRGEIIGAVGIFNDITDRKPIEEALHKAHDELELKVKERTAELEARNAEMERFVYTVSHELRTPLVSISGLLGFLKLEAEKGELDRMTTDYQLAVNALSKMDQLLGETLELSRIGRIVNPPENVPFDAIAKDALDQEAEKLKSKGVEVSVATDLPMVCVDRTRIAEVLVNLIENSIKYMGDQALPKIEIGHRKDEGETVFFVRDNGMGIDPSQHEKVFGLFYRLDPKNGGTGVGLTLVKRIIEVHGGRIWIESELGKGCTVCFTLPLANVG